MLENEDIKHVRFVINGHGGYTGENSIYFNGLPQTTGAVVHASLNMRLMQKKNEAKTMDKSTNPVIDTVDVNLRVSDKTCSGLFPLIKDIAEGITLDTNVVSLKLEHVKGEYGWTFDANDGVMLGDALMVNSTLTSLTLQNVTMAKGAMATLGKGIQVNTGLQSVHVLNTALDDVGAVHLAHAVRLSRSIQSVNLHRCELTVLGTQHFVRAIGESARVHTLDLSYSDVDITTAGMLAALLAHPTSVLRKLDLTHANLDEASAGIIVDALATNSTLKYLDIGLNKINDVPMTQLGQALATNKTLESLSLVNVGMTPEGLDALVKGCMVNTSISLLDVGLNSLDDESALSLVKRLLPTGSYTWIGLSGVGLTKEGLGSLYREVRSIPGFEGAKLDTTSECGYDMEISTKDTYLGVGMYNYANVELDEYIEDLMGDIIGSK